MRIDSHHHLWKYSPEEYGWINDQMAVLRTDFQAAELGMVAEESSIDGFVSVQARTDTVENDALLTLAKQQPLIKGIVGWVPFVDSDVRGVIERYVDQPLIKGFREVMQGEPDERFLANPDFDRGIHAMLEFDLVYDVLIFANQLTASIAFVDRHPQQRFVLDHIAKPTITSPTPDAAWEAGIRELARRGNVDCKFSGVATEVREQAWTTDLIRPYWNVVLDAFGPNRLMYGSDWPVCLLQTEYAQWFGAVESLVGDLTESEQQQILGGTAVRAYRLTV